MLCFGPLELQLRVNVPILLPIYIFLHLSLEADIPMSQIPSYSVASNILPTQNSKQNTSQITFAAQTNSLRGSFLYDSQPGGPYMLEFNSLDAARAWLYEEEQKLSIELRYHHMDSSQEHHQHIWMHKLMYVCGRSLTGGKKKYERKTS